MANKILTEERIQQILSRGVKDMPQNPASQGYTKDQIREFYYKPEELILEAMSLIEDIIVGADGIDERLVSLKEKITGANGLEGKVETLETDNIQNKENIESLLSGEDVIVEDIGRIFEEQAVHKEEIKALEEKTKILNVDPTKSNNFLSEDGSYKPIRTCDCEPFVVDKELNENSTNVVENQAIAKAIKGKQDKLTAGKNIKIDENGVISAEGGSDSNVEANPTEEATEDLSKLKVGETVYSIPKEILQGTTAPTTETKGELGQFYTDTLTGASYKCTTVENSVYTWVEMVDKTQLDAKLDIPSEAGKNKCVVGFNASSKDVRVFTMGSYIEGKGHNGSIAVYHTNGCLRSPTPINNEDVATKGYVDNAMANAGGGGGLTAFKHAFSFTRTDEEGNFFYANGEFLSLQPTKQVTFSNEGVYIGMGDNGISIIGTPWINEDGGIYPLLNDDKAAQVAGNPCYAYFFSDASLELYGEVAEAINPYTVEIVEV